MLFFLESLDITLDALPVGANKTARLAITGKLLTNEDIKVVLPVPAYPFNKKILPVLIDVAKLAIDSTISSCSFVRVNGKFFSIFS